MSAIDTSPSAEGAVTSVPAPVGRLEQGPIRLAATVFVQYGLIALAIRYVTDRNFVGAVIVNVLIAFTSWYITRGIAQAHTRIEQLAYVIGGTTGAVAAVYFS